MVVNLVKLSQMQTNLEQHLTSKLSISVTHWHKNTLNVHSLQIFVHCFLNNPLFLSFKYFPSSRQIERAVEFSQLYAKCTEDVLISWCARIVYFYPFLLSLLSTCSAHRPPLVWFTKGLEKYCQESDTGCQAPFLVSRTYVRYTQTISKSSKISVHLYSPTQFLQL